MSVPSFRLAAIGDSYTEGVGDEGPDGLIGWADRLAAALATELDQPVGYANLAVRGRLLDAIVGEQLDAALALEPLPTVMTICGGGNNLLRPRFDLEATVERLRGGVERALAAGVQVVLISGADPSAGLPLSGLLRGRGERLAAAVAKLAEDLDLVFVDVSSDLELRRPQYWSDDRLHLNAAGHTRAAGLIGAALTQSDQLAEVAPPVRRGGLVNDLAFYRQHVAPWVLRRLRRQSSGDGRSGKRPEWTVLEPAQLL